MLHPVFPTKHIFAPGPTPLPDEVRLSLSVPPLHHRTEEFSSILESVRVELKKIFQTNEPCYVLAASGTGGMEASLVNLSRPSSKVLVINGGKFGERWVKMARAYQLSVVEYTVPWGEAFDINRVNEFIVDHPSIELILCQACETSTCVLNPIKELSLLLQKKGPEKILLVVDAITALGVVDMPMDDWKLDVVIGASHKAFMLPPGLSFLSFSAHAQKKIKALRESKMDRLCPTFYFDMIEEEKAYKKSQTAWTPSVQLIMALEGVLKGYSRIGIKRMALYYENLASSFRQAISHLGLQLFSQSPSPSVTGVFSPEGISADTIISDLKEQFGITVAEGQDQMKGKIFRIAHLGFFEPMDMAHMLGALEVVLSRRGYPLEWGSGVGTFLHAYSKKTFI